MSNQNKDNEDLLLIAGGALAIWYFFFRNKTATPTTVTPIATTSQTALPSSTAANTANITAAAGGLAAVIQKLLPAKQATQSTPTQVQPTSVQPAQYTSTIDPSTPLPSAPTSYTNNFGDPTLAAPVTLDTGSDDSGLDLSSNTETCDDCFSAEDDSLSGFNAVGMLKTTALQNGNYQAADTSGQAVPSASGGVQKMIAQAAPCGCGSSTKAIIAGMIMGM